MAMVELVCDAIDGASYMPEDCYLSVRVGGVQRLARLSALAASPGGGGGFFRFPVPERGAGETGRRQGAKFEVFRRLGAANSADLEPSAPSDAPRNVTVNCAAAGFGKLRIRLVVKNDAPAATANATDAHEPRKRFKGKEKNAREYLAKHDLETQLSEVMQAVLRERPDNPAQFLATKLLGHGPHGGVKAATAPAPLSPAPPPPVPDARVAAMPERKRQLYDRAVADFEPFTFSPRKPKHHLERLEPMQRPAGLPPPQAPNPPPAQSSPGVARPEQLPPGPKGPVQFVTAHPVVSGRVFAEYYCTNFRDMGASAFEMLHARFRRAGGSKPREVGVRVDADGGACSDEPPPPTVQPSMGTWLSARPTPLRKSAKSFHGSVLHKSSDAATLTEKPPSGYYGAKPSVGSWESLRLGSLGSMAQSSVEGARPSEPLAPQPVRNTGCAEIPPSGHYGAKPSAGIEGILPFRRYYQRNLAQSADRALENLYGMFGSVGSRCRAQSASGQTPADVLEKMTPLMEGMVMAAAMEMSDNPMAAMLRWLEETDPCSKAAAEPEATWHHTPSVGTWLAKPRALELSKSHVRSYRFRPSVGTWLCPHHSLDDTSALGGGDAARADPGESAEERHRRLMDIAASRPQWGHHGIIAVSSPASEEPGSAAKASPQPTGAASSQPSAATSQGVAQGWLHSPSVGTWLSAPHALRPSRVTPRYSFRPSVGTWLCPRTEDVSSPEDGI